MYQNPKHKSRTNNNRKQDLDDDSGDFDDFNTIAKTPRKLKYRNSQSRSISKSKSRKIAAKQSRAPDFYDVVSQNKLSNRQRSGNSGSFFFELYLC